MRKKFVVLATLVASGILFYSARTFNTKPLEVVVSIKPIHSLVCALSKGVTEPKLLLDGYYSPHHVQLVPSQVQAIQKAKSVIWIGPAYEQPLEVYVQKIDGKVLTIQDSPLIKLKRLRTGILWDENASCDHGHDHSHHHHHTEGNLDGHLWLDPHMMIKVVDVVSAHLKSVYPSQQGLIEQNARAYKKKLEALYMDLLNQMELYKGHTYIIQHDGNQYFDAAFGVKTIATISIDPSIPPSAGHMLKIKNAIASGKISPKCLFAERQIDGALAKSYASTVEISFEVLDYLGAEINPGENAYEQLMQDYVAGFIAGMKG